MPPKRTAIAVGLVAAALIVLQISFTRLLGYKLFYHFVFLAIALSLLGLGAAGTYVAVRREPAQIAPVLRRWLAFAALLTPVALLAMARPPLELSTVLAVKLLGDDAMKYLGWCSLFMVALNFAGGVVLTHTFKRYSEHMGRLYFCDLVGAGLGCLLSVALMKYFSPPLAFLAAAPLLAAALAACAFDPGSLRERAITGSLGALAVALAIGVLLLPKELQGIDDFGRALVQPPGARLRRVIKYEWNHVIRTDHVPGDYVLDGEASTPTVRWDAAQQRQPVLDPTYAMVRPGPRVAIIGFGGGPQVAEARVAGASHIVGVDINPSISRWVVGADRELNQGLFTAPNIEVINAEGRHTIRSQRDKFDVIVMHAIDTYTATAAGAYALTENFLYTKEALIDYLGALNPGGVMSIRRWLFNPPRENLRLFATALQAFEELGYAEPGRHVMMLAPIDDFERLRRDRTRLWGYLMISPTPFEESVVARTRDRVKSLGWSMLYTPGGDERTPFRSYFEAADREAYRRSYPYVIKPVTDASPYLFQFYNPFHKTAYRVEQDWATSGIYQSSATTLFSALGVSVVASLLLILGPLGWASLRARRRKLDAQRLGLREVVFFACLGVGFMALEVPLTQVLALYLGHPVFGFSVVLVALLLSSGVGSLLAQRRRIGRWKVSRWQVCAVIAGLLVVLTTLVFPMVHGTIQLPDALRFALALIMVVVCGLPMGFPLALAVQELGERNQTNVAWAWGINGAASVVGSCLVMMVMVYLETRWALAMAAACYALAAASSYPRHAAESASETATLAA